MYDQNIFMGLPGADAEEIGMLQAVSKDMNDGQKRQFLSIYQGRRKDQNTMLILTLIGFLGVAGIQRVL